MLARKDSIIRPGTRIYTQLSIIKADYHPGNITVEELLAQIKECSKPLEDDDIMEQFQALFSANADYLSYLYKCIGFVYPIGLYDNTAV